MCIFLCDAWYACLLSCCCFHLHNCYHLYFKIQFLCFSLSLWGNLGMYSRMITFGDITFSACLLAGWALCHAKTPKVIVQEYVSCLRFICMEGNHLFAWPHWFSTKQTWGKQTVQCSLFWIHWCTTKCDANALFEMLHWQPGYLFFFFFLPEIALRCCW